MRLAGLFGVCGSPLKNGRISYGTLPQTVVFWTSVVSAKTARKQIVSGPFFTLVYERASRPQEVGPLSVRASMAC